MSYQSSLVTESAIREELLSVLWSAGQSSDALLLQEVGLLHGAARADVVMLDTEMAGFEIKSAADSLEAPPPKG